MRDRKCNSSVLNDVSIVTVTKITTLSFWEVRGHVCPTPLYPCLLDCESPFAAPDPCLVQRSRRLTPWTIPCLLASGWVWPMRGASTRSADGRRERGQGISAQFPCLWSWWWLSSSVPAPCTGPAIMNSGNTVTSLCSFRLREATASVTVSLWVPLVGSFNLTPTFTTN